MDRRQLITGAAALTTLMTTKAEAAADPASTRTFLELTTWRLHNSDEGQAKRVSDYLETGLFPALCRVGRSFSSNNASSSTRPAETSRSASAPRESLRSTSLCSS